MIKEQIIKFKPRLCIKVRRKNGEVRIDKELPCHSFVNNFYLQILQQIIGPNARSGDNIKPRNTAGTPYSSDTYHIICCPTNISGSFEAGVSNSAYGFVVGDGSGVWGFNDPALGHQLTEGIGPGHLSYGAQSEPVVTDVGDIRTVTRVRSFYNNAGLIISVEEVGWYLGQCTNINLANNLTVMVFRDVFDTPIVLAEAEELEVSIAVDLTYPETIT